MTALDEHNSYFCVSYSNSDPLVTENIHYDHNYYATDTDAREAFSRRVASIVLLCEKGKFKGGIRVGEEDWFTFDWKPESKFGSLPPAGKGFSYKEWSKGYYHEYTPLYNRNS